MPNAYQKCGPINRTDKGTNPIRPLPMWVQIPFLYELL